MRRLVRPIAAVRDWLSVPNSGSRVIGLDFIRAVAIALVMTCHFVLYVREHFEQHTWMFVAWAGAFWGVELFFVLSGFLIGQILFREYQQSGTLQFVDLRRFWVRRWFRTLPAYYAVLFLCVLLQQVSTGKFPTESLNYLAFLQNVLFPDTRLMGVSWSLSIEEWFYLSFPFILLGCVRLQRPWARPGHTVLYAICVYGLLALICKAFVLLVNPNPSQLRETLLFRMDAVLFGVVAAWAKLNTPYWRGSLFRRGGLFIGVVCIVLISSGRWLFPDRIEASPGLNMLILWGGGLAGALLLPSMDAVHRTVPLVDQVALQLSSVSYSLYLLHEWILVIVAKGFALLGLSLDPLSLGATYFIVATIVCSVVYKLFELPMTNLRERFS